MSVRELGLARVLMVSLCAVGGFALASASADANLLPDGRVYEAVSPIVFGHEANVDVPGWAAASSNIDDFAEHGVAVGAGPLQVRPDGNAVVYAGDPPLSGGNGKSGFGGSNEFLATRSASGSWTQADLQPPGIYSARYETFSSDLSVGILLSPDSLGAEEPLELKGPVLYSHTPASGEGGEFDPLANSTPLGAEAKELVEAKELQEVYAGANSGTSSVAVNSHLLFVANDALTPNALYGGGANNLYDLVNGRLYLVNVLPNGETEAGAIFGIDPAGANQADFSHVVSADGSRVFWTDLNTGDLYVRENDTQPQSPIIEGKCAVPADACTVLVSEGGQFWTASGDGSKVLYTKGDLYEYDVTSGQAMDLTPGVEVAGVLGASEDGEYIYYADSNDNLSLWHDGVSTFIATLSAEEAEDGDGDWNPNIGNRTSEVTPDGHSLIFISSKDLTGYDNVESGESIHELFLYEADSNELRCVSCDPTGQAPVPTEYNTYRYRDSSVGALLPEGATGNGQDPSYQPQMISNDGDRVFFQSDQPLVPQETDGWLNVYEWERDGSGSCREDPGCIYLLSGGTDPEASYLVGASSNGDDVIIVSRAQLLAGDKGDDDIVYDARVGGVEPPAAPECSGSGCQGVPPAPPIFATPSSVTFNGVGNFPPPFNTVVRSKTKTLTTTQKLAKALKACRVKRRSPRRSACEAGARKRYASKSKAKKSYRRSK